MNSREFAALLLAEFQACAAGGKRFHLCALVCNLDPDTHYLNSDHPMRAVLAQMFQVPAHFSAPLEVTMESAQQRWHRQAAPALLAQRIAAEALRLSVTPDGTDDGTLMGSAWYHRRVLFLQRVTEMPPFDVGNFTPAFTYQTCDVRVTVT